MMFPNSSLIVLCALTSVVHGQFLGGGNVTDSPSAAGTEGMGNGTENPSAAGTEEMINVTESPSIAGTGGMGNGTESPDTEAITPSPSISATEFITTSPTDYPTASPYPTETPTATPVLSNDQICDVIDDDWEGWYEDGTDAEHTCTCEPPMVGMDENRFRMKCLGESLYCCAATGVCYETNDDSEHVVRNRTVDEDGYAWQDVSIWNSCTNFYEGGLENPTKTHTVCFEFAYASSTADQRQTVDPPLSGCSVSINGQECSSCTPCEQNGVGFIGYDCANIPGIDQIPGDLLPEGPQTACFSYGFPECAFNGGFVEVELGVMNNAAEIGSGQSSASARTSVLLFLLAFSFGF